MSWRDQLRPGSFRGVSFEVAQSQAQVGRRTVIHEFPGLDLPLAHDLGRRARRYRLEALVIGPDYMQRRDALVTALETPGPARLVHPYWGELTVVVEGAAEISESTAEGGMARISVPLVEAAEASPQRVAVDHVGAVEAAAQTVADELEPELVASFSVDDDDLAAEDAANIIDTLSSAMNAVQGTLASAVAQVDQVDAGLAAFAGQAQSLARAPGSLARALLRTTTSLIDLARSLSPALLLAAIRDLACAPQPDPLEGRATWIQISSAPGFSSARLATPRRVRLSCNRRGLLVLNRGAVLSAGCRASVSTSFAHFDEAMGLLAVLNGLADELLAEQMIGERLRSALRDLRSALAGFRRGAVVELPRLATHTPGATTPLLLVAHALYGDARRAAELQQLNRLRHPLFVPGGEPLQVVAP